MGSGRRPGGLGLGEELLERGLYAAGQDDHGAPGLARDAPGDAAEHHRAERAVTARAANEQIEPLRQLDEHLGGVTDERVDLRRHAFAELGHGCAQPLLRLDARLTLDGGEVLARPHGRAGLGLQVERRPRLHDGEHAQRRARGPRQGVRSAQRLAGLLAVVVGDADCRDRAASVPCPRHDRNRAGRAGQQARSRRAGDDLPQRAAPARADDEERRVLGLGGLVQRAGGAGSLQLAALHGALRRQLVGQRVERLRAVGDEVAIGRLHDGGDAGGGGPDRQHRRARLDGDDDQPRAGQPGDGEAELDRSVVGGCRVVADDDGLGHAHVNRATRGPVKRRWRARGA